MSTHTLEIAESICDQVAIIHKGRILTQGTVAELQALAGYEIAWSAISFVLVPLICRACVIVPMQLGARHLQQRQ